MAKIWSNRTSAWRYDAFLLSTAPGSTPLMPGCTAWTGDVSSLLGPLVVAADALGAALGYALGLTRAGLLLQRLEPA